MAFTYKGDPIPPLLIQQFECWLSDGDPVRLALDVGEAWGTNEFDSAVTRASMYRKGARIGCKVPDEVRVYFDYERLGALRDGTQVVVIYDFGGGTGVWEDLLFLRFHVQREQRLNGETRDRLVLTLVDNYSLGDRDEGTIDVFADRVVVGVSAHRSQPLVLTLPKISPGPR